MDTHTCAGCGRSGLSRTGYWSHIQQSRLPECKEEHDRAVQKASAQPHGDSDMSVTSDIDNQSLPASPQLATSPPASTLPPNDVNMDVLDQSDVQQDGNAYLESGRHPEEASGSPERMDGSSGDEEEERLEEENQRRLDLEQEDDWEPPRDADPAHGDELLENPLSPVPMNHAEQEDGDSADHDDPETAHPPPPPPPPSIASPIVVKYGDENPGQRAGHALSTMSDEDEAYGQTVGSGDNVWAPFSSKLDWEVAKWAKLRGPGSTALTELLAIEGVVNALKLSFKSTDELNKCIDNELPQRPQFKRHEVVVGGESFELYARDVIECIRALWRDPEFAPYLAFEPERHYADGDRTQRLYHDMNTGKWWWATQKQVEQQTGKKNVTIVPIIISSDKTQLTTFRNKQAYPVYMTIGNIPKHIRRKPSRQGQILLAYLPTSKLDHIPNKSARRRALANLFHACISFILEPLKAAGVDGLKLKDGNGNVRRGHPVFACFVGDHPEQTLVGAVKQGDCPVCPSTRNTLDDDDPDWDFRDLEAVLAALNSVDEGATAFKQNCLAAGIKPVQDPFWKDLPFVHIYRSITPDVLHQLYQGVVKHLISWLRIICSPEEIDARCRRLPPNHNIRLFLKGISHLSRVTGTEHDQITRFLLGLIIDVRLPHGYSNVRLLRAVRGLLDFIYLARLPVHSTESLDALDVALETFTKNRDIFIDLEVRTHFRIPKFHFLRHYRRLIELYGTTDNFNTEYTERLHIDMAKDAYRSTNHKDEYPQMTAWLDRRERILLHNKYIQRRLEARELLPLPVVPPAVPVRLLRMALHPTFNRVSFSRITEAYGASDFELALKRFIVHFRDSSLSKRQVEDHARLLTIPFQHVSIYHRIKFVSTDPHSLQPEAEFVVDSIHCDPASHDRYGTEMPGRFDTVLVRHKNRGSPGLRDFCVARVRCVFTLPKVAGHMFGENRPPQHLAYVDWYTPFNNSHPAPYHGLYRISPHRVNGKLQSSVIPITLIQQSVHLIPHFGPVAPAEWKSSSVLDSASHFFVNSFTDRLSFTRFACA